MEEYPYVHTEDSIEYMLTTIDNPFDPFTEFDQWFAFDARSGYNTPGLLDAIAQTSDDLSDLDQLLTVQMAIDEIIAENVSGVHRKVKRGDMIRIQTSNESESE